MGGSLYLYTTPDGILNTGVYVAANDQIAITGDLDNSKDYEQDGYTVLEMEYMQGRVSGLMDVTTQIMDVNQCKGGNGVVDAPMDMDKSKK